MIDIPWFMLLYCQSPRLSTKTAGDFPGTAKKKGAAFKPAPLHGILMEAIFSLLVSSIPCIHFSLPAVGLFRTISRAATRGFGLPTDAYADGPQSARPVYPY